MPGPEFEAVLEHDDKDEPPTPYGWIAGLWLAGLVSAILGGVTLDQRGIDGIGAASGFFAGTAVSIFIAELLRRGK